ncbi:MAG: hypothetical protein ACFE9T_01885 [Promethearchaeota archaeon]
MTKDALKFFQSYIIEMIDVGGPNLPKSISSSLGAKLGKLYKERGIIGIENSLKKSYKVLNASPNIKKINGNTYEVTLKYKRKFCPIGGKHNPKRADLLQESLCRPYTSGFLNEIDPSYTYKGQVIECNLKSNKGMCSYILTLEKKKDHNG